MRPPDVLGVLVKAPEPGRVKTRLAADIGAVAAAALYLRLGREIVAECAASRDHHTLVWYAPAEAGHAVVSWLRDLGVDEFIAQPRGGLGARMSAAFRTSFGHGASRVLLIGSDCPGVDRALLREAFDALGSADVVLGPTVDGGYYLIGLSAPAPGLFRRVTWSTASVFGQTMANAKRLGLAVAVLRELRDVDTVDDACALDLIPDPIEIDHTAFEPLGRN